MLEITLENLENDIENKITPEMLFGEDEEKTMPDVNILKSLLDKGPEKSPFEEFISEHTVGIPYSAEMFEAGQEMLKSGLSVIPVGVDKRPLISWKEFQERIATEEELRTWFRTYKDMQLGIVTGKISNLIVVDIDKPDLDVSWLPETTIVKTGSGGFHYYYLYTQGFTNKARIKEFVDIRADGGYVIAPPSKNLKGKYEWKKRTNLAVFPVELFAEEIATQIKTPVQTEYPGYGEGQRNEEMAKYIGHIVAKIHPTEWDSIAYPTIQQANEKNRPPLSDWELKNTFDSICGRERRSDDPRWYKQELSPIKTVNPDNNLVVKKNYTNRYTWGTRNLDTSFSIIKRGNFIVIGAKSGSGKTTFAFDMAQKNAVMGHKVLFISLEMEESEVKNAVARKKAGITIEEEYDYAIPPNKQLIFEEKLKEIENIKYLYFKGVRRGGGLRWEQILDIIYGYVELDLIFIDNLDLIEGEAREHDLERQKRIVKNIMGFTAEKQVPIILIHHYRKTMGKESKVASIDDLSGSKKICDGADRVLNISRNTKLDAKYPEKYESMIYLQKGREYDDSLKRVFFMKGTFMDEPLSWEEYYPDVPKPMSSQEESLRNFYEKYN